MAQKSAEAVSPASGRARGPHQNAAEAWWEQGSIGAHIKDVQVGIGFPGQLLLRGENDLDSYRARKWLISLINILAFWLI